jgi:phosphoglycerate dehydrogenase-like enzyme
VYRDMAYDVICLRPEADFRRIGATAPETLSITYRAPDDPELPVLMKEARALVIPAVGPKLTPALFENANVTLVQVTGAGVDRVDEATMKRLGIAVANVPGGSNAAVAEYAVTHAAMLLRRFGWSDQEIRGGNYDAFRKRMLADNLGGLEGAVVGIVGLGVIGLSVARAFRAAQSRIVYFDTAPRDTAAAAALEARSVGLDELLETADVVTLHVPLLNETRNMIGARELARMKAGAVLVNAARGGVVDEAALAAALESGKLGGAAVDVYTTEPPTPDNPLLRLEGEARRRLVLTPHIAGVTRQAFAHLFREAWNNVERVLKGGAPLNRVY